MRQFELLPWADLCRSNTYGGDLTLRLENVGTTVEFAGMRVFLEHGWLKTRIMNPNLDSATATSWTPERFRFRSGREFMPSSMSRGQVQGHIARVLDNSNMFSVEWVPLDLYFLYRELSRSGWLGKTFFEALTRVVRASPSVTEVADVTRALIRRHERLGRG